MKKINFLIFIYSFKIKDFIANNNIIIDNIIVPLTINKEENKSNNWVACDISFIKLIYYL